MPQRGVSKSGTMVSGAPFATTRGTFKKQMWSVDSLDLNQHDKLSLMPTLVRGMNPSRSGSMTWSATGVRPPLPSASTENLDNTTVDIIRMLECAVTVRIL